MPAPTWAFQSLFSQRREVEHRPCDSSGANKPWLGRWALERAGALVACYFSCHWYWDRIRFVGVFLFELLGSFFLNWL
jgi:hypothetical protein